MIKRLFVCFSVLADYNPSSFNAQEKNLDYYVDPFIGTGGHNHTFPRALVPFWMVQLSPNSGISGWAWCSGGYHYSEN